MRIKDLAHKDGRAGHSNDWRSVGRVSKVTGTPLRDIYHYSALMLTFNEMDPRDPYWLDYSTGWGTVSDQHGMNKLFRELNLPLYYVRHGGARIERVKVSA